MAVPRVLIVTVAALMSLASPSETRAQWVRAYIGEPFGVAHLSLTLPDGVDAAALDAQGVGVLEPHERVFYPAITTGRLAELAGELLGTDEPLLPNRLDIAFLFRGAEPFPITVRTPHPQQIVITPMPAVRRRGRQHHLLLVKWWRDYNLQVRALEQDGDYPPLVETYLTEMLSARLGLAKPLPARRREEDRRELFGSPALLLGTEKLTLATIRETMRGGGSWRLPAEFPVPNELPASPPPLPRPDGPAGIEIEPLANHVPEECFYIRFGSFQNYLWMDHLKDDYAGNLAQMITLRGHNARLDEKAQRQLALIQSATKELFGPQVIADVAMIGRDLYLADGAALGMLFEARDSAALRASFDTDRREILRAERDNGATLETVTIAGHDVSYLSTPDNRVRSFYAADGDFHLVTTSRSMVERFFEAGRGQRSLGRSPEFVHARTLMPLDREDTVFVYFSSAFFRGLLSPQYQIGLSRRLESVTNDKLLQLATLAATGEGRPAASVRDLVDGGFLPPTFARLDEPRQLVSVETPRTFPPIPDVPLDAITAREAEMWEQAATAASRWPLTDPLMVAVKRFALDGERMERVVIDAHVSPLVEEKYGWLLGMVGPPTDVEIHSNPADVIAAQMSLRGGTRWPNIPAHHLFVRVADLPAAGRPPSGRFRLLNVLRTTPGVLGAWPTLGLLDRLPLMPPPDVNGFSQLPLGLWRWQGDGFSVLSFHRDLLADAAAHLHAAPTENPAQIRLRVGDLSQSHLAGWIDALSYARAAETSTANVRLLNALALQFHLPPAQALDLAGSLLDTELVCPLGGTYALHEEHGAERWRSTAWTASGKPPADYRAPLLTWFRGATAEVIKSDRRLTLHAEIDMQRQEREPQWQLPLFKLFQRPATE